MASSGSQTDWLNRAQATALGTADGVRGLVMVAWLEGGLEAGGATTGSADLSAPL